MSPKHRVSLVLNRWEGLGSAQPRGQLSTDQRVELARRDAELDVNPGTALTWEQIRASVEKKR